MGEKSMVKVKKRKQKGFSLIELMIAMLLGVLLLGGAVLLFDQGKSNAIQDEQVARMQENGRYALRILSHALSMANYWGGMIDTTGLGSVAGLVSGTCEYDHDGNAGTAKISMMDPQGGALMLFNNVTASGFTTCIPTSTVVPGTDMLAVKRVADQPAITVTAGGVATGSVSENQIFPPCAWKH
jgi:prepilin-type N-terminal cleavage/methylation domain-containing protein